MLEIKTLHLTNALSITLPFIDSAGTPIPINLGAIIGELDSCILKNMANPAGPLIMKTTLEWTNSDSRSFVTYIRQVDSFIPNLVSPFTMEATKDVLNCIYVRYEGPEKWLLSAFREAELMVKDTKISLTGEIYTIFVSHEDETDLVVTDLYIPTSDLPKNMK